MVIKFNVFNKTTKEYKSWDKICKDLCHDSLVAKKEGLTYWTNGTDDVEILPFTGMVDKNGREIFVGDIIKIPRFIQYNQIIEGEFTYEPVSFKLASYFVGEFPVFEDFKWLQEHGEVAGNIFENDDLLYLNITNVAE